MIANGEGVWSRSCQCEKRLGRGRASLLLRSTGGGCNLAGAHEVANILLQELVVTVELVVLFTNSFYAVKDINERFLQSFGVSGHC